MVGCLTSLHYLREIADSSILDNMVIKNMNTIRLMLIGDYLYPTDSWSRDTLVEETNHDRFKKDMLDILSPRLVKKGYKLAISYYI